MAEPMCHGRYFRNTKSVVCSTKMTDECPLKSGKYKLLEKEPCCRAIYIPARYLIPKNDGTVNYMVSARKYVEECLL